MEEISAKEVSEITGFTTYTVNQWVKNGSIKRSRTSAKKNDKQWLDKESVDKFLKDREERVRLASKTTGVSR